MKKLETFYLTFGQKYPWRNGWVEVEAENIEIAEQYVRDIFDNQWSNLYAPEKFDKSFFSAGKLGETIK